MKKIVLFCILSAFTTIGWAQSQTFKGVTKEGKKIEVVYNTGALNNYVETVKYDVLDELRVKVNKLQADSKEIETKLKNANKRISQLESSTGKTNNEEVERLRNDINEKEEQLSQCHQQLGQLELQIDSLSQVLKAAEKVTEQLHHELEEKEEQAHHTGKANARDLPPYVGLDAGLGLGVSKGIVHEQWRLDRSQITQASLYFGTVSISEAIPISLEACVSFHQLNLAASSTAHSLTMNASDIDYCDYQAQYTYSALDEKLLSTYIGVPFRICFGHPHGDRPSLYARIGVTPSFKVSSSFGGNGTYSLKGYYEQWHLTLEDIEELGFVSGANCYDENTRPDLKRFVLWGNAAFGGFIPLGSSPIQLNAGISVDYPITTIGSAAESVAMPEGCGLLQRGGRMPITNLIIGLIYML